MVSSSRNSERPFKSKSHTGMQNPSSSCFSPFKKICIWSLGEEYNLRRFFPYAMNPTRPYVCCSKLQYLQGAHLPWKSSIISFFTWMKCEYSFFFLKNHYTDWIVSGSNRMGFSTQLFSTDWKCMALLVGADGKYSGVSKTEWKTLAPVTFKNVLSRGEKEIFEVVKNTYSLTVEFSLELCSLYCFKLLLLIVIRS